MIGRMSHLSTGFMPLIEDGGAISLEDELVMCHTLPRDSFSLGLS